MYYKEKKKNETTKSPNVKMFEQDFHTYKTYEIQ